MLEFLPPWFTMGWPQVVLTAALVMITAWLIGALGERLLRQLGV